MMDDMDKVVILGFLALAVFVVVLIGATVSDITYSSEWECIEPVEEIGWATYCDVGNCHVLFYGEEFRMECNK